MIKSLMIPLAFALVPAAAQAQSTAPATPDAAPATAAVTAPASGTLTITDAYALSNNPRVGAVFMTIANQGQTDCVLTGATSKAIAQPELHTHTTENGVMKMVQVDSMTVPAGGTHLLQRGGDHIMLLNPNAPLAQGQDIDLALDFGTCGTVPLTVRIDNQAGMRPAGAGAGAGGMRGMHGKPAN